MKLTSSKKAISSLAVIILFYGCSGQQALIRTETTGQKVEKPDQDWYGTDIKSLPFSNNADTLTEIANELSVRSAPSGQKYYAFRLASQAHELDKQNKAVAITLSRTSFLVADSFEDKDESNIKKNAEIGVKAARIAGVNDANPAACYYFALNQGLIVRIKGLFALNKLPEIVEALKIAQKVDSLDAGGPLRVLGMLYLKAPAWPTGIGDLDKSLEVLKQAVTKYPTHPQNFIFYAEALIEDDNKEKALEHLDMAYKLAVPEIWGVYYSKKWRTEIDTLKNKISK